MKPISLENRRARLEALKGKNSDKAQSAARVELRRLLEGYLDQVKDSLTNLSLDSVARVAEELLRARDENKRVYLIGNGGSAPTASHAATDWVKPNKQDSRGGLNAVCLVDNVALLTAWANDTSFDNVFAAQLKSLVQQGDVVIAISGSGNSPNILRAVEVAKVCGATTVGFSGFEGGELAGIADINVIVPADHQGTIEDVHMTLVHALTVPLRQVAAIPGENDETAEKAIARRVAIQ